MKTNGLTGRIFLGMVIGLVAGIFLMKLVPVGIQPGDILSIRVENGSAIEYRVDEESAKQTPGRSFNLIGQPLKQARLTLSKALDEQITAVSVKERKAVTVRHPLVQPLYLIGELFIRFLKMLVVPLILGTVFVGVASLTSAGKIGRIGRQTLLFYAFTAIVAVTLGIALLNIVRPGNNLNWRADAKLSAVSDESPSIVDLILRIIPTNPVESMANGDVLGMLFFAIVSGLAVLVIDKDKAERILTAVEGVNDIVFVLIDRLMYLAPIGVGALIAYFIAIQEPEMLGSMLVSLGKFAACVVIGLFIHFVFLTLMVRALGKYPVGLFLKKSSSCLMTALGTSSSNATLPVTMACSDDLGVSRRISGFVVPVGATANMDGTALYEAAAALFFAQAFGVNVNLGEQVIVAVTSMLAAVGAAGIPSAGLITMTLVLSAVGLPLSGIALLFAIDRPLDMLRTAVNVYGDVLAGRVLQTWNPQIRPEEDP